MNGMFSWYTFFMTITKIKHVSFESWEKRNFDAIFGKICYVACAINCGGQLICLLASLHERDRVGVIDKPALKSKVQ